MILEVELESEGFIWSSTVTKTSFLYVYCLPKNLVEATPVRLVASRTAEKQVHHGLTAA